MKSQDVSTPLLKTRQEEAALIKREEAASDISGAAKAGALCTIGIGVPSGFCLGTEAVSACASSSVAKTSVPVVVGGGGGSCLAVALGIGLTFFCIRRLKQQQAEESKNINLDAVPPPPRLEMNTQ